MEAIRSDSIVNNNADMKVIGLNEKEEFFNNILDIDISKPRGPYNIFSKEQNIDAYAHDLVKRTVTVSKMWNKLSEKEKEDYEKKRQEEVKRYDKNMSLVKKYLLNPDILNDSRTPYTLFAEVFAHYYMIEMDVNLAIATKKAKIGWDSSTSSEKDIWKDQLNKEKEILKEIQNYKPSTITANNLFCKDMMLLKCLSQSEAAEEWKTVDFKTKEKYYKKEKEMNQENEKLKDLFEIANGIKPKLPFVPSSLFMADLSQKEVETKHSLKEMQEKYRQLSDSEKTYYKKKYKMLHLKYQIKMNVFKKSNPEKAKRNPSALRLWYKDNRERLRLIDGGHCSIHKLRIKVKEEWLKVPEIIKEDYDNRAKKIKKDFLETSKDLNKPEKPLNPYNNFTKNFIKNNKKSFKGLGSDRMIRECGDEWTKLSEKEKLVLYDKYESEMEVYNHQMANYAGNLEQNINASKIKSQSKYIGLTIKRLKLGLQQAVEKCDVKKTMIDQNK